MQTVSRLTLTPCAPFKISAQQDHLGVLNYVIDCLNAHMLAGRRLSSSSSFPSSSSSVSLQIGYGMSDIFIVPSALTKVLNTSAGL